LADKLNEPIFTPATKATDGHDENISFEKMVDEIGTDLATKLRDISLEIYRRGSVYAEKKGIILADSKFEFGILDGEIILIDEVLTPDSSRFWPKESYKPGISPPSYDKQIVRDHLENSDWNKQPPVPELPENIIRFASEQYLEIESILLNK
jgi:phosphoribosylaminoimidazole-succinocarboxamide synthase